MVAAAISVFAPVKNGRRWVGDEEVDYSFVQLDGNIPVALGGEPESFHGFFTVKQAAFRFSWLFGSWHIPPEKFLKGTDLLVLDGIFRENQHAELPRKASETKGISWSCDLAIPVQVHAGGYPGINGAQEPVGISNRLFAILRDFQVVLLESVGGDAGWIKVEFVNQQHIGLDVLNNFCDTLSLGVCMTFQVSFQFSALGAIE